MAHAHARQHRSWPGSLEMPLLHLSAAANDNFTIRDASTNIFVCGAIGSGKSTGFGATVRRAMLRAGLGGIVHVAKAEEIDAWLADARACGRLDSVIILDERQGYNFIAHELSRQGADGINSVVEFLMRILEIVRRAMPDGGRVGDAFWESAARQLLRMILPVLYAATGTVRMEDIVLFLTSAPTNSDQWYDEEWRRASFAWNVLMRAKEAPATHIDPTELARIALFWRDQFARQDAKLRTNITATVSTSLDRFLHGRLAKVFTQDTTIVPELIFGGAIIIMAMPTAVWNEDGVVAQQLFKYATQRAVLSRNSLPPHLRERPVFIYADEAQNFLNSFDAEFLSQSRSSLCVSVYLTQSLPTLYAKIGGENAKHFADMLLAQFGTKVFCSNSCPETNRFAADTIGRSLQRRATYSEGESTGWNAGMNMGEGWNSGTSSNFSFSPDGKGGTNHSTSFGDSSGSNSSQGRNRGVSGGESLSHGWSEVMDYDLEPAFFSRALRTGGPTNGGIVDAIWFQAGRTFSATGRPFLLTSFQQ